MAGSLWPDSPLSLARIWKSRPKQPMNITCMAVSELENSARSHICSIYKLSPWAWKLSTLQKLMSRLSLFISKWSNKPQEPVEGREWNSISRASHMCHLTFMVTVQVGIIGTWLMWKRKLRTGRLFLQSLAGKWFQSLCLFLSILLFSGIGKAKQKYKASRPRCEWSLIILPVSLQGLIRMPAIVSCVLDVMVGAE